MPEPAALDPDRAGLEQILHTALDAGVQVQKSGGYTARVYDTMNAIARALGADRCEGSVTSVIVGLTVHRGEWSRTAFHRTPSIGVDFTELSELSRLAQQAPALAPEQIRERLDIIRSTSRRYPTSLVMVLLGVACGAFAALFGADAAGVALAGLGGWLGATVRHGLAHKHFKPFIFCLSAAFVSTLCVNAGSVLTDTPSQALAACVLYLVPGVPLLNGTADLLATHYLNGIVRLTMALVIVLSSGIGVGLALAIWGWAT